MSVRRCSRCHKPGHNRSTCETETALPDLAPDVMMRTMIDPLYAVWLVTEGSVGEALSNATRGAAQVRQIWGSAGDAMVQALAELELRARTLPPEITASCQIAPHGASTKRKRPQSTFDRIETAMAKKKPTRLQELQDYARSAGLLLIADVARMAGYRKRKDAPGSTSRMYFQFLSRLA